MLGKVRKKSIFVYYHRYSEKRRQAADVEKQQIRLISYFSIHNLNIFMFIASLAAK